MVFGRLPLRRQVASAIASPGPYAEAVVGADAVDLTIHLPDVDEPVRVSGDGATLTISSNGKPKHALAVPVAFSGILESDLRNGVLFVRLVRAKD